MLPSGEQHNTNDHDSKPGCYSFMHQKNCMFKIAGSARLTIIHLPVTVYSPSQSALPEHVVIAKGGSGFSGIEIPDKLTRQGDLSNKSKSLQPFQKNLPTSALCSGSSPSEHEHVMPT